MTTQISTQNIQSTSLAVLEGPKITNIQITNSGGTVLDDTAVALTGGYIKLTGSGFQTGCQIKVAGALATSVTFISSTEVRAQVAAASAGTYDVYFTNPDGSTAIRISGLTYSATPTWVTASSLPNQQVDVAVSVQLEATGATTYSLQSGSSLPSGLTLSSGGLISGTVTGIVSETTYNFTVEAIDNELQDSPRAFSVTVTLVPQYRMYSWGQNVFGILGLGDSASQSSPTQIGSDTTWDQISIGQRCAMATKTNGTLWTWGQNSNGQLGLNDIIYRSSPVQVGSATNWSKVSAGRTSVMAIKTDGTLWMWGINNEGQLGLNDKINRSSPVQVGSSTDWNLISATYRASTAIKTNGTLWTWGVNFEGQLGLGDRSAKSSPVQVGFNTWTNVSMGKFSTIAVGSGGTLWAWGNGSNGRLGLNDTLYRSSPVQVGSSTDWNLISVGDYTSLAIKTNNTLWSWGYNNNGQLGLNSTIFRSSPVQVGSATDWELISNFAYSSHAIKTNGTLWSWGLNNSGQLGLGTTFPNQSSPVQVGTATNWDKITSGYQVVMAITKT